MNEADQVSACREEWIEEVGEIELIGGWAEIKLPDEFISLADADHYQVFLTGYAPVLVFVQNRTARGFEIHALPPVKAKRPFDACCGYRVVARRKAPGSSAG